MSIEYPCVHFVDKKCKKFSDEKFTSYCAESPCGDQEPSNADRIRAMSDEELAEFLANFGSEANNGAIWSDRPEEWMEWLKQPAEEWKDEL